MEQDIRPTVRTHTHTPLISFPSSSSFHHGLRESTRSCCSRTFWTNVTRRGSMIWPRLLIARLLAVDRQSTGHATATAPTKGQCSPSSPMYLQVREGERTLCMSKRRWELCGTLEHTQQQQSSSLFCSFRFLPSPSSYLARTLLPRLYPTASIGLPGCSACNRSITRRRS